MIFSSECDSGTWLWVRLTEPPFLAVGAAFGTSKAGIGIAGLGQFKPELIMKVPRPPIDVLIVFSQ
jgi:hypothetical protein